VSRDATERAAIGLALATPVLMIASRGIAPVVLALVVGLLAFASWRAGRSAAVLAQLREGATSLPGLLSVGFVALLAASLSWTPALARGAEYVLHVVGSLALVGIAAANARVLAPKAPLGGAAAVLLIASLAVTLDILWEGRLRGLLGFSTDLFRLNRAALALALLLPLVTALLWEARRLVAIAVVWLACLVAIFSSESTSAQLGVVVVAITLALALAAPVATSRLVALVAIAATLGVPSLAPVINDLIPQAVHDAVGYGSLTIRGEIWREYAELFWERPVFGFGVEAGHVAATLPAAAVLSDAERELLNLGAPPQCRASGLVRAWSRRRARRGGASRGAVPRARAPRRPAAAGRDGHRGRGLRRRLRQPGRLAGLVVVPAWAHHGAVRGKWCAKPEPECRPVRAGRRLDRAACASDAPAAGVEAAMVASADARAPRPGDRPHGRGPRLARLAPIEALDTHGAHRPSPPTSARSRRTWAPGPGLSPPPSTPTGRSRSRPSSTARPRSATSQTCAATSRVCASGPCRRRSRRRIGAGRSASPRRSPSACAASARSRQDEEGHRLAELQVLAAGWCTLAADCQQSQSPWGAAPGCARQASAPGSPASSARCGGSLPRGERGARRQVQFGAEASRGS
jgi:hypothetical protein